MKSIKKFTYPIVFSIFSFVFYVLITSLLIDIPFPYGERNMFAWLFAQDKSKDNFVKYQMTSTFRILDSNGNTIITEDDIVVVDYSKKSDTVDILIYLNDMGKSKLAKSYANSGGKEFTVYCLSQKIYSFTATTAPIDNLFLITDVFNSNNYFDFYSTVQSACFEK